MGSLWVQPDQVPKSVLEIINPSYSQTMKTVTVKSKKDAHAETARPRHAVPISVSAPQVSWNVVQVDVGPHVPESPRGQKNACNQVDDDCDGRTDEETVDVCNQVDDDCDGRTDEDHQISDDVCNGIDDDCDGRVDEAALCEAFGGLQCFDGCVNGCCQAVDPPSPLCVIDSDGEKQCP